MPKTKEQKKEIVENLSQNLKQAKIIVLTDHLGLNANDFTLLRKTLKENQSEYRVAKKTLLKRALNKVFKSKEIEEKVDQLEKGLGLILSFEDEIKGPKIAFQFSKEKDTFKVKGGIWLGNYLGEEEILSLAQLPSKEILLSQFIRTINSPLIYLDYILKYNLQRLISILKTLSNK